MDRLLTTMVATAIATVKHFVMDSMRLLGGDSLVDYSVIIWVCNEVEIKFSRVA